MKSVQIIKPYEVRMIDSPVPEIETADDVLIKIKYVGICGSDMHIFHGSNPFVTYPKIFGHEFAGEVIETGENVKDLEIGDHVICEPIESCGTCYACQNGRPNVCKDVKVLGVHKEGGCQEIVRLHQKRVFKIDKSVPWKEVILAEPLTIGAQVCRRGDVKKGEVLFIMGAGTIGLCIMLQAIDIGAVCIVSDIVEEKLAYAKSLGASYAINANMEDVNERVYSITDGMGANVVADTICTAQSLEEAIEVASVAGRVVVLGFGDEKSRISSLSFVKRELSISGSRLQSNQFPRIAKMISDRSFNIDSFVDKVFPIDDICQVFEYADKNMGRYRKIVVEF